MRINAPEWIVERLRADKPFFSVRINDGEMTCMYRTAPAGKVLGTDANPQTCDYDMGDALRKMVDECAGRSNVLFGHCCHDDPGHILNATFWGEYRANIVQGPEAGGHWPLDGVVDGSTRRMLETMRDRRTVLVTSERQAAARHIFGGMVTCPTSNSWEGRQGTLDACATLARLNPGTVFAWCAGAGLKPSAWQLWRDFPSTSHVDLGHLFNGACGLEDYGWLQRRDGPWWEPYFRPGGFADWVRSFAP